MSDGWRSLGEAPVGPNRLIDAHGQSPYGMVSRGWARGPLPPSDTSGSRESWIDKFKRHCPEVRTLVRERVSKGDLDEQRYRPRCARCGSHAECEMPIPEGRDWFAKHECVALGVPRG